MFTVYHSNQIDVLKSLVVEIIKADPLTDPFKQEHILVQSPGMSQWLNIELAKTFGVAANIRYPLPATFIWEMFIAVLPDVPQRSAFNKDSMTWKLMEVLPTLLNQPEFSDLSRYLSNDDDNSKCYQLCEKIADVFDGYLVYRPDWIAAWEAEQGVDELAGQQPWQGILWRALYDQTLTLGQSPYHRANLYDQFIESLSQYQTNVSQLPSRLFVFGITALPPRYLAALHAIGQHIDVHLMFTNPCKMDWSEVRDRKYLAKLRNQFSPPSNKQLDIQSPADTADDQLATEDIGNSLLASMGKMGRDNLLLLNELGGSDIDAFADLPSTSLLHQIQDNILHLEEHQDDHQLTNSHHKAEVDFADPSLSFHACHSAMREVEVLHDQLLYRFADEPNTKPRDIIVMVADINAYSAAIQAVFGSAPQARYIPFSISDRAGTSESPIFDAFMQLVALPNSRCLASELLNLLETPAILANFKLSNDDFTVVKRWTEGAGIRWGLNLNTAADFDLPSQFQNTWQFGIQRMLLGYAMNSETEIFNAEHGELTGYSEVQGMNAALVGNLAEFIDKVSHYRQQLCNTLNIDQWQQLLLNLLDDFFTVELHDEQVMATIRDTIAGLKKQLEQAAYQQGISPAIMLDYLKAKLSGSRVSQRFLSGQVNFCTLMPMRSIPFKVVCLLGMNDGQYPRTVTKDAFDLMQGRARAGDRSRRNDDRYMFLEAIISAQHSLYISYIGQSLKNNEQRAPSVLVTELMEYCHQNYRLSDDAEQSPDTSGERLLNSLITRHSMTPFGASAFNSEKPSFADEWLPAANRLGQAQDFIKQQPQDDFTLEIPEQLTIGELQNFWRAPVEYFFRKVLKVNFGIDDDTPKDDEPFVLDGLESYQLRDKLLQQLLRLNNSDQGAISTADDTAQFIRQQQAAGRLPIAAFADISTRESRGKVVKMLEKLQILTASDEEIIDIDLIFERPQSLSAITPTEIPLRGKIAHCYQQGLVKFRSGRIRSQDYLSAWLEHLMMNAMGVSRATHLLGFAKNSEVIHLTYPAMVDSAQAKGLLRQAIEHYFSGLQQPIAYLPECCLRAIECGFDRKKRTWQRQPEQAKQSIEKQFLGDGYNTIGEGSNPYIARVWPSLTSEVTEQALILADELLKPALLYLHGIEIEQSAEQV